MDLKFVKKNAEKKNKTTPKKKLGMGLAVIFKLFHSPQPNNIGPAWQQPRAPVLISLSLVRGG